MFGSLYNLSVRKVNAVKLQNDKTEMIALKVNFWSVETVNWF